jgi:rhodanese-related sulfurtransferase
VVEDARTRIKELTVD